MSEPQRARTIYWFDQFCLDLGRGALRGPDGADLALRPKAFLLLQYLLDNPDRLLSRDDLLEALWPGLTVSDDSLTQCVSDLRRALGDRANDVLRTVPRRGYMLGVEVEKDAVEPAPAPRPAAPPASFGSDSRSSRDELLVMERLPASQDDMELLNGIWNELFLRLARFKDLRVVRGDAGPGAEGYRVRCDARVLDGHVRASVLLEDAETGVVVWTEQIDEPIGDRAATTERVIIPLAHRLTRQAVSESRRRARHKSPASLNARELCLLAGDHHQRGTEVDTATALALLDRAIALDPDYAPAYAWQAYAVQRGLTYGWGALKGEAARDRALALARHGAVLAPDSPLCLARLAYCLYLCGRWDEAILTAHMALTGAWTAGVSECVTCSEVLAQGGHPEEAVEVMRRTLRVDPYAGPTVYSVLGRALLMAGRPQEALPELRICAARLPDYAGCHHSILMAAHESGLTEEACRAYGEIQRLQPGWSPLKNAGPWFFRNADDEERLNAAFNAARATALQGQRLSATGDVLDFRLRDGTRS